MSVWGLGILVSIFPEMNKQLAFREYIKTSKELATRKKEMALMQATIKASLLLEISEERVIADVLQSPYLF